MDGPSENIRLLFEPRGVAVVGASANPAKIGFQVVNNLRAGGYQGRIFPVNPRGGEILGLAVYRSLLDIDGPVDIACLVIPAGRVLEVVADCAQAGVKNLVVITSGFAEIGNAELEKRIVAAAAAHGMRVLGPNIFGIYSSNCRMNATFGPKDIKPGQVAIITQSGAIGVAMIGKTATENIGLSAIVSVGNTSDIDEADLLEYLIEDQTTKIILMYIEGVKDGQRLIQVLNKATREKPVIVIKAGRSQRGAVAVASHTGSLAGADAIFDDIMRQCGVLRAESIQEALDWSMFLSAVPQPKGENAVIVTNGGGMGVLATDACEKFGVELYADIDTLDRVFSGFVPAFGSTKNPIDLTGGATVEDYAAVIQASLEQEEFHSILALFCETAGLDEESMMRVIEEKFLASLTIKPIVFILFGGEKMERCAQELARKKIPVFTEVVSAVSALGALYRGFHHRVSYQTMPAQPLPAGSTGSGPVAEDDFDDGVVEEIIRGAQADGRSFLLAPEASALMQAANIPMPRSRVAKSLAEAEAFAEEIGYPVVMKIVSKDILHKSDAGGVALDLLDRTEVLTAYQAIEHNCRVYNNKARIEGIEVCQMVRPGTETIIGAQRNKVFGPVLMFGLGGIYVEVMKDVSFRSLPVNPRQAFEMVSEIKSFPLLMGVRGEAQKDIPQIIAIMGKISKLILRCQEITDVEVNPLMVYRRGEGCLAVDARILISKPGR